MVEKQRDIIIANPIYDVVFKNLMTSDQGTNKANAGFFVGTVLGEDITDIELLPQEYTYHPQPKKKKKTGEELSDVLTVVRLDFVATIRTKSGEHKKVLIEIQKTQRPTDLLRFRTYLGEQYKLTDSIEIKGRKIEKTMPIVVIYMLGFELPEIAAIAVKADRKYVDIIHGGEINGKSPFIESLTHDGYFMQIPRITAETFRDWDQCSRLEQMLSLFEQNYFIEENFYKKYPYPVTDKNIKNMVETLAYIVADPKTKRIMQEEYWAALDEILWEKQARAHSKRMVRQARQMARQARRITTQSEWIATQSEQIATQSEQITTQSEQIATLNSKNETQSKQIAELRRLLQQAGIDAPSD